MKTLKLAVWSTISILSLSTFAFGAVESSVTFNLLAQGGGVGTLISLLAMGHYCSK